MLICRERHHLQNNRRRWPGLGGCGPTDRRAGGLVGGGMPAAASSSARLRAALEGSKDRRMGHQACRAIPKGLAAPGAGLRDGTVRPLMREGFSWRGGSARQ